MKNTLDYLTFLKAARDRASLVLPAVTASLVLNGDPAINEERGGATGINAMIKAVEEDQDGEGAKKYAALVKEARDGNVEAKAEVTTIRVLRTNNFLMANSNWLSFFSNVNLAPGTAPSWVNDSRMETKASELGADGKPRLSQALKMRSRSYAEWKLISTESFEYPLFDPLRPGITEEVKALVDLAGDLDEQISQLAKPFVTGACVASFTNSGKKGSQTRTYVLHSSIHSSNIPAGNRIDASAGARWGKAALDKIIEYCASWGKLFDKRPLRPVAIFIPSKDFHGILSDITLTSQGNTMVEEIIGTGILMNYAGYKFVLIPDETLSSSDGFAYVKFDRDFGEFYTMSAADQMNDVITEASRRENKGYMDMSKWISFIAPLPHHPFVARVQYK